MKMLFNEIYGNYYRVISIILKKVIEDDLGDLTNERTNTL